jgi:hypothetical protein
MSVLLHGVRAAGVHVSCRVHFHCELQDHGMAKGMTPPPYDPLWFEGCGTRVQGARAHVASGRHATRYRWMELGQP